MARKLRVPHPMKNGSAQRRLRVAEKRHLSLPLSAAPLALAIALAACADPLPPPAPAPVSAPAAVAPTSTAKTPATPSVSRTHAPSEVAESGGKTEEAAPPQTAEAPPSATPEQIMGLTRAELSNLLGKPHFLRRDAPAEIWQYRGGECILDVFLYEAGEYYRVLHFEVRDRTVESISQGKCLAALLEARKEDEAG